MIWNRFKVDYSDVLDKWYIEDRDSENDVRLYINGDFASSKDVREYGEFIAGWLNNVNSGRS